MIWSISWKNIWRNKVRSGVVIAAITLGIFGGVFSTAVMIGMIDHRIKEAIGNEVSHIQIHDSLFLDNNETRYIINNIDALIDSIKRIEEVKAISSRIKVYAMASTSASASGVIIKGVDAEAEKVISGIPGMMVSEGGEFLGPEARKPIFIGDKLARELKLTHFEIDDNTLEKLKDKKSLKKMVAELNRLNGSKYRKEEEFDRAVISTIGKDKYDKYEYIIKNSAIRYKLRNKIVLSYQSVDGNIAYDAYRVAGVYRSNNALFDAANVYVKKSDLCPIIGLEENQANELAVLLKSNKNEDKIAEKIRSYQVPDLNVQTWKDLLPDISIYNEYMDFFMVFIVGILLLAMGFGIVNTMLMAVLERVKELGMLMAVGMNKRKVFSMIMLETILLCMVGAVLGMIISYLLILYTAKNGIDLTAMYQEGMEAWGFSAHLYPEIGWDSFIQVTVLVVIAGILASIYPARKALKLKPSEALRIDM